MKYAADFRRIAREALRGHWVIASLASFIASLIGASIVGGGSFSFSNSSTSSSEGGTTGEVTSIEEILPVLIVVIIVASFFFLIAVAIHLCVGGPAKLGYAKFNLALVDKKEARIGDLFSQFRRFSDGFLLNLLTGLYTFLWSLLFIIPGIIKSYSYAMTPYILYEDPELSANEAITKSRKLMDGNKGRLFCLLFSFIGWSLLASLPVVIVSLITSVAVLVGGTAFAIIGILLMIPAVIVTSVAAYVISAYQEAAQAAFYREITQTALEYREIPAPEINDTI